MNACRRGIWAAVLLAAGTCGAAPVLIDHRDVDVTRWSLPQIERAKAALHIAYGHTSHGSQLTEGMSGLVGFANGGGKGLALPENAFAWNDGGTDGALDLHDYAMCDDVGYYPDWVVCTSNYLDNPANADVNVVIWSWCWQVYAKEEEIQLYLDLMSKLESDFPRVKFVYMTGHADGSPTKGQPWEIVTFLRNNQIREYCLKNGKILYDFNDIECYDPDGNYFGDKLVNDACDYDSDGDGKRDRNWAVDWQNAHPGQWFPCEAAHTQPVNANLKAYAAWHLWARLAGWDGK